jgi:hypothetical protein
MELPLLVEMLGMELHLLFQVHQLFTLVVVAAEWMLRTRLVLAVMVAVEQVLIILVQQEFLVLLAQVVVAAALVEELMPVHPVELVALAAAVLLLSNTSLHRQAYWLLVQPAHGLYLMA